MKKVEKEFKRLDVFLVEKKYCESRKSAQNFIKQGNVSVDGKIQTKCAYMCGEDTQIEIEYPKTMYVSRGGYKLEKALNAFSVDLKDKFVLDIGSSTGGFCDCALQNGASQIVAIDVGSDQLSEKLRADKRIHLYENTDVRNFTLQSGQNPTIATVDVSFISLKKVIQCFERFPTISECILLVKPQYECGKDVARKCNGVIKDFNLHKEVLADIYMSLFDIGFYAKGVTYSPIRGGDGNVEYLIYANKTPQDEPCILKKIKDVVERAKKEFR